MESEWTMFRASISDAVSKSCDQEVVRACCGENRRTYWCTLAMREVIKRVSSEAADRYQVAKKTKKRQKRGLVVMGPITCAWEEFLIAIENDLVCLKKVLASSSMVQEEKNQTGDIYEQGKEFFEDHLNLVGN